MKTYEEMARSALIRGKAIRNQRSRSGRIWIAIASLAVLVSVIFFAKDYHAPIEPSATSESAHLQVPSEEQPTSNSTAPTVEDIAFCELPLCFGSVQELVSALRTGTCQRWGRTYSLQSIKEKMDSIYIPAAIPAGYVLYEIDLTEHAITYLYVQEEYGEKPMFYASYGMIVDFSLYPMSDPLSGIADQYDIPVNEEGYIYSPEDNKIYFAPGNTWMAITVPDSMNHYGTLKSLCVAERVSIQTEAE